MCSCAYEYKSTVTVAILFYLNFAAIDFLKWSAPNYFRENDARC